MLSAREKIWFLWVSVWWGSIFRRREAEPVGELAAQGRPPSRNAWAFWPHAPHQTDAQGNHMNYEVHAEVDQPTLILWVVYESSLRNLREKWWRRCVCHTEWNESNAASIWPRSFLRIIAWILLKLHFVRTREGLEIEGVSTLHLGVKFNPGPRWSINLVVSLFTYNL